MIRQFTNGYFTELKITLEEIAIEKVERIVQMIYCLLYTSPSPRDRTRSRMPSSA